MSVYSIAIMVERYLTYTAARSNRVNLRRASQSFEEQSH
jgi:hypothetical protein